VTRRNVPELVARMLREPLAQRYFARMTTRRSERDTWIHTADDVLGERIARLAALIAIEHERPGYVIAPKRPNLSPVESLIVTAELGLSATPYLWTEEVRAGLRSVTVPQHVLSPRVLPQARTWHTFETGIELGGHLLHEGRRYEGHTGDACLVCDTGKGLEILNFGEMKDVETGEVRPTVTGGPIRYGVTYPDDLEDDWRNTIAGPLAMFAFLASPYIPKQQAKASRAARREYRQAGLAPIDDELVTFVILRRPATHKPTADEPPHPVDWKHRWLVNGHIRAQWYPSEQAHRLIWIAPYLKGPEDAPMLEHAYKVAR
jgi:hypothetical protein